MASLWETIRQKAQKAKGNLVGNVKAIANPQTRAQWFGGFTFPKYQRSTPRPYASPIPIRQPIRPQVSLQQRFWQSPVGQGMVNVQRGLESPFSAKIIPTFQTTKTPYRGINMINKVGTGALNLGGGIVNTLVSKGVIDPSLDIGRLAGAYLTKKEIPAYNTLKSPQVKLGYNIMGINRTPQKVLANIAGTLEAPFTAYGGGKVFGLGKDIGKEAVKQTFIKALGRGIKSGTKYGGVFGTLSGLESGADIKDPKEYILNLAQNIAQGAGGGAIMGGGLSTGGYVFGKVIGAYKKIIPKFSQARIEGEAKNFIFYNVKKALGLPVGEKPTDYHFVRKELGLPNDYRKGFVDFGTEIGKPSSIKGGLPPVQGGVPLIKEGVVEGQQLKGLKIKQTVQETVQGTSEPIGYTPLKTTTGSILQQAEKSRASSPKSQVADSLPNTISKSEIDVKNKVNLIDYLRTPDRIMRKIGLGKEMDTLRTQYEKYLKELPQEIDKVTQWSKRVNPQSNQKIFKYLDGQDIKLNTNELKVANEVETYLSNWADRLNLPKDKRISQYITHIFEKDFIKKEFDPELAKIIQNKVAGSVYDPFLEQRLGKMGYVEDTWRALDAYVKRATRKVNIDIALKPIKDKAKDLEISQFNYVKKYIDNVNLRPSDLDNLIDNTIKSVTGYRFGQRPTASLTKTGRQAVYRGALGLNVGSAIKNLTQGVNTYSKLGEKYTIKGYWDLFLKGTKELEGQGLLKQNLIQDRSLSSTRKFWERLDKGLFWFFETAEKINRGPAYYGAKAKALAQGLNEQQAIEYGKKMVRDTQFTFGSIDTPVALQSDIAKLVAQFQTYGMKQVEFLGEMVKNKEYAGLLRYALGTLAISQTLGKLIGMEWKDFIPSFRIGTPPTLGTPVEIGKALLGAKDKYGNVPDTQERLQNIGKTLIPYIPAGVQMKKTLEGLTDVGQGYSATPKGLIKYPVEKSPSAYLRGGLFGRYNLPEAQEYYQEKRSPLGTKQSARVKIGGKEEYEKIINKREQNNAKDQAIEAFLNGDRNTAKKLQQETQFKVKSSEIVSAAKKRAIEAFLQGDRETARKLQQTYKFKVTKKEIYGR